MTTTDAAHQPLISPVLGGSQNRNSYDLAEHDERLQVLSGGGLGDGSVHDACARERDTPTTFVWTLTAVAGLSGLLFGYDTGIISSTLLHLDTSLSPNPPAPLSILSKAVITSSTSLAALLVSPASGLLADSHGRKRIIYLADFLFVLGALWQSAAKSVFSMVMGRFIVGLGIGVGSGVVPMYIAELAPAKFRGRLTTLYTGCITGGSWSHMRWWVGWRVGVGLGALPALAQAVGLCWQPESPRWLVMRGRQREARRILGKVLGLEEGSAETGSKLNEIEEGVRAAKKGEEGSWKEKWVDLWNDVQGRRALWTACMAQGLQQLCGFNSLMYFSATIFSLIGFSNPTATSMIIAATNLTFTLLAFTLIDRIGRRRILLLSIPGMILGLAICAVAFDHLPTTAAPDAPPPERFGAIVVLFSITLYVASYALGIGTVPWTAQNEVFKMQHRGLGSGIATGVNWLCNFAVGITFLGMLENWGGTMVFGGYAAVCAAGWWGVWRWFWERGGMELEEGMEDEGVEVGASRRGRG
ncbi:general substrate transporter [Kalaharituber pfeilii]|nr:general substrate transporter [Kalaharituber pfeilii]